MESEHRLAEVVAALSLAADLGTGQTMEHALRACLLTVRLAGRIGLGDDEISRAYYLALLRSTGCTATAHELASAAGDDVAFGAQFASVNYVLPGEAFGPLFRYLGQMRPWSRRARIIASFVSAMPRLSPQMRTTSHCEVAQRVAARLGFEPSLNDALAQTFERWDGRGMPRGLKGEEILLIVRIAQLAEDATAFYCLGGVSAATAVARRAAGKAHDPELVDMLCRDADSLLAGLDAPSLWDIVLASEPRPWRYLTAAQREKAARAIADFADQKSPYLAGHSPGVAQLAAEGARRLRLAESEVEQARLAGFLHDVGRTGVSSGIWDKVGPLTSGEWERVRLHPYYTERILARAQPFAALGALASLHHERLDSSGYHRGVPGSLQPVVARLLAAADVYQAMREPRPHRPAHSADEAAATLAREAGAGRLDSDVVQAVLSAAGQPTQPVRHAWPAGLSDREVEVLRLIARGRLTRQIAQTLVISEKTADHHIQHIYNKIGVSTRAGATFFALEHGLVGPDSE